jgi:cation diffusion facilitator CzcD-associated flavoprotein CzcO
MPYEVRDEYIYKIRKVRVVCIGAGLTGIAAVHKLQNEHADLEIDFQIYEKNHDVGGTWLENRYPGCACDVPAHSVPQTMLPLTVVYVFMGRKSRLESVLRWGKGDLDLLQEPSRSMGRR